MELSLAVITEHKLLKQTLISSKRALPPTPFHMYPGGGNGMHRDIALKLEKTNKTTPFTIITSSNSLCTKSIRQKLFQTQNYIFVTESSTTKAKSFWPSGCDYNCLQSYQVLFFSFFSTKKKYSEVAFAFAKVFNYWPRPKERILKVFP